MFFIPYDKWNTLFLIKAYRLSYANILEPILMASNSEHIEDTENTEYTESRENTENTKKHEKTKKLVSNRIGETYKLI